MFIKNTVNFCLKMSRVYVCVHECLCMFLSWAKWTFDDIKEFSLF